MSEYCSLKVEEWEGHIQSCSPAELGRGWITSPLMKKRLCFLWLIGLLFPGAGTLAAAADTLIFVPQVNNFWPDPSNWFTADPATQKLTAAGRSPQAGESVTISAHVI